MLRCRVQNLHSLQRQTRKHASQRLFSCSALTASGHSKWSTIKHDKAKNDGAKHRQRTVLAREIALATKLKGHDPTNNARLATAIEKAKKGSVPKAVIQAAIARGQGKSTTGAKLEPVTLEAIVPPSVGIVVECETDNRARTLGELRLIVKNNEGNVTPTAYMFEKKGRIVLRAGGKALTADEVLESALESGALDTYEEGDGRHVVLTEPSSTFAISQSLAASLDAEIEASDIIWKPNEDTTALVGSDKDALALTEVLASIQEQPDVLAVYANIAKGAVSEPNWAELQSRISL